MNAPVIGRVVPAVATKRFGGEDFVVLLADVGILTTAAWLGPGMRVPLSPGPPSPVDLSVRCSRPLYQLMTRPETSEDARRAALARPPLAPPLHARVGALAGFLRLLAERGGRKR